MPVALYQAVGPAGKSGTKLRRAGEISLSTPGLDLATKLRVFQRALRGRVERRDALLDIVRAVNTTLEPPKIAETIVERAATWVPAPCWAVVSSDLSGQLSVLADRGLTPDMGPAVYAIATWVMSRGAEFVTADLRHDPRVQDPLVGAVMAFPLSCRGRRVGAVVGLDRQASAREPRLAPSMLRQVRVLLEPASVALDKDIYIGTVSEGGSLQIEMRVQNGRGYVAADPDPRPRRGSDDPRSDVRGEGPRTGGRRIAAVGRRRRASNRWPGQARKNLDLAARGRLALFGRSSTGGPRT
jgi:hypothetical protein